MNGFTNLQKVHIAVGVSAFITWIGLLIASRMVADGAGFLATFSDVITLAKTTAVGAVSIATAIGNFMPSDTPKVEQPAQVSLSPVSSDQSK